MPTIPQDQRAKYRNWALDNNKRQSDKNHWVPESDWQDFLLRKGQ